MPLGAPVIFTSSERLPANARVLETDTPWMSGPQLFHPCVPLSNWNSATGGGVGEGAGAGVGVGAGEGAGKETGGGGAGTPPPLGGAPEAGMARPPALRKAPARLFMKSCPSVYTSLVYELCRPSPLPKSRAMTPLRANFSRCAALLGPKKYSGRLSW
jgi:hypothetical protein